MRKTCPATRFLLLHASFCLLVEKALAANHIVPPDVNQEVVLECLLSFWVQDKPAFVMQTVSALSDRSHPLVLRSPNTVYRLLHRLADDGWLQLNESPGEKRRKKLLPTTKTERYVALLAECLSEAVKAKLDNN